LKEEVKEESRKRNKIGEKEKTEEWRMRKSALREGSRKKM
jgi:hypothetical protein